MGRSGAFWIGGIITTKWSQTWYATTHWSSYPLNVFTNIQPQLAGQPYWGDCQTLIHHWRSSIYLRRKWRWSGTFVAAIANNTSLKSLEFNYVDSIRHWRLDDIVALLNPDSSALVELNLSDNIIDEGLSVIGRALGNNSILKTLDLGSNRLITPTGGLRSSSV